MTLRQKEAILDSVRIFPRIDHKELLLEHERTRLESKVIRKDFQAFDMQRLGEIYREEHMMNYRHIRMI